MRFRIVRDAYVGFEVQHRRWWWPFLIQTDYTNTHSSIESAERWARSYASRGKPLKEFTA